MAKLMILPRTALARTVARRPRRCTRCGRPYHRRNLAEAWFVQSRDGRPWWTKQIARVCTTCLPPTRARVMLTAIKVQVVLPPLRLAPARNP